MKFPTVYWIEGDILPKELVDLTMEQDEETKIEHFIIQDVINDMDDKKDWRRMPMKIASLVKQYMILPL